jgi:MFS family permease
VLILLWVVVEVRSDNPLVDMSMMRIRAVWTTNLAAATIGGGMFAAFIVIPQVAQAPKSTGYGYGASVIVSGFYLLPSTIAMATLGSLAGRITRRFGSKAALLAGSIVVTVAFAFIWVQHSAPIDMYLMSGGMGFGMGLAYSAMANIIVQAVPANQTGVAGGMNTVVRLLGGAVGGQISATFIADHTLKSGLPSATGYTMTYALSTIFLLVCVGAAICVPGIRHRRLNLAVGAQLASASEAG